MSHQHLQASGLGQVHTEPISAALISSSHLRRGVTEVFLDVAFIDFGAAGEAGPQRMAREQCEALFFR